VVIAPAARDTASIDSAIRGWIVPVLVKEFLAENVRHSTGTETKDNKPTTKPMGKEDVADISAPASPGIEATV
jgi:hypothetical protein